MSSHALALKDLDVLGDVPADARPTETDWGRYHEWLVNSRIPQLLRDGVSPEVISADLDNLLSSMALIEIQSAKAMMSGEMIYRDVLYKVLVSDNRVDHFKDGSLMTELIDLRTNGMKLMREFNRSRRELTSLRQELTPTYPIQFDGDGVTYNPSKMRPNSPYIVDVGGVTFVAVLLDDGSLDLYHLPEPFDGEQGNG